MKRTTRLEELCSRKTISRFEKFIEDIAGVKQDVAYTFLLFDQMKKKGLTKNDYDEVIFVNLMLADKTDNEWLMNLKDYTAALCKIYDDEVFDLIQKLNSGDLIQIYNIKYELRSKRYTSKGKGKIKDKIEELLFDREFLCKIRMSDNHIVSKLIQTNQLIPKPRVINNKRKRMISLESAKQYLQDYTNKFLLNTREISKLINFPVHEIDRVLKREGIGRKVFDDKIRSNYIIPYDEVPYIKDTLKKNNHNLNNFKNNGRKIF